MKNNLKKQLEEDLKNLDGGRKDLNLYIRYKLNDPDVEKETIENFEYYEREYDNLNDCLRDYEIGNTISSYIRNTLKKTKQ